VSSHMEDWDNLAEDPDASVLLIIPPFHSVKYPSLAAHLLQACCREAGFPVQVLYANISLASIIGEDPYEELCHAPEGTFMGERFFARCAFGLPPLGRRAGRMFESDWVIGPNKDWEISPDPDCNKARQPMSLSMMRRLERCADEYLDEMAKTVNKRNFKIVGCSTSFEQTTASVALLNHIKALKEDTITVVGGANCAGDMAHGIAKLPSTIDYVFAGECEVTFPRFVQAVLAGQRPQSRIIHGEPFRDMNALPLPDYREFREQQKLFLPMRKLSAVQIEIPFETSRGCWWGQKHHCSFCGFDEEAIAFRQKSPDRVIEDLRSLLDTNPCKTVSMTDSIMPYAYFRTLVPRLADKFPGITIFYEQKANLSLEQVLALKRAGITAIQPGIESLSSGLLTLMKKGVSARQNLGLLRYARSAGMDLHWCLLWGFPGDEEESYKEILSMLPLIHHLPPPHGMAHLSIDRFSPYFSSPHEFGVSRIRPLAGYYDFLPKEADISSIAYHFTATYRSASHENVELIERLWQEVGRWKAAWHEMDGIANHDLRLFRTDGAFVLLDTRDLWREKRRYTLGEKEASALVTPKPYSGSKLESWAARLRLALITDGWFVPLVVAEPQILLELMGKPQHQ
jgi:ribosomal peptide maturation radical SAM protein 1